MYRPAASIHMHNASQALADGKRALDAGETDFSLQPLTGSDSAAIAVLLDWQRHAQQNKLNLVYKDIPASLLSFANVYGVDIVLNGFITASLAASADSAAEAAHPSH